MMKTNQGDCIKSYIRDRYSGHGLIGISDLAQYCHTIEGEIYVSLLDLQKQGEIKIITRYFCPEGHLLSHDEVPYCHECDYKYSYDYITELIYVEPLKINQEVK